MPTSGSGALPPIRLKSPTHPLELSSKRLLKGEVESAKLRKITELGGWSTVLNLGSDDANREASRREATELTLQSRR
jgi:hypothetical protein